MLVVPALELVSCAVVLSSGFFVLSVPLAVPDLTMVLPLPLLVPVEVSLIVIVLVVPDLEVVSCALLPVVFVARCNSFELDADEPASSINFKFANYFFFEKGIQRSKLRLYTISRGFS